MIRGDRWVVMVLLVATATGCSRLGLGDGPSRSPQAQPQPQSFEPLPAVPTAPVTQGALQPLPPLPGQPVDPNAPASMAGAPGAPVVAPPPTKVASAGGGAAIGRTDLLGSWKVTSSSDSCQLSASLTSWAGGYRASSRGCTSPDLQKISAWVVQGNQVILKGADGSTAATLTNAGPERFSGTTSSNQPVALSR